MKAMQIKESIIDMINNVKDDTLLSIHKKIEEYIKAEKVNLPLNDDMLKELELIENGKRAYIKASSLSKKDALKEIETYRKKAINNLTKAQVLDNYIEETKDCLDRERLIAEARNEEISNGEELTNPKYEEARQNFVKEINSWLH